MSKKVKKVGDFKAVRLRLWRAILRAENIMDSTETSPEQKIKAIHCLIQLSGQYISVCKEVRYERNLDSASLELEVEEDGLFNFKL